MSVERTYEALLRSYPRAWRERRGDEVIGLLMTGAEAEGRRRPRAVEAMDLIGHGLLERARTAVPSPDLVALGGLVSAAVLSTLCFVFGEWWPWPSQTPRVGAALGPFFTIAAPLYLLAPTAVVLTLIGLARAARAALILSAGLAVLLPLVARVFDLNRPTGNILFALALMSALGASAPIDKRRTLLGLTVAFSAAACWQAFSNTSTASDGRGGFYVQVLTTNLWPAIVIGTVLALAVGAATRQLPVASAVAVPWVMVLVTTRSPLPTYDLRLPLLALLVLVAAFAAGRRFQVRAG